MASNPYSFMGSGGSNRGQLSKPANPNDRYTQQASELRADKAKMETEYQRRMADYQAGRGGYGPNGPIQPSSRNTTGDWRSQLNQYNDWAVSQGAAPAGAQTSPGPKPNQPAVADSGRTVAGMRRMMGGYGNTQNPYSTDMGRTQQQMGGMGIQGQPVTQQQVSLSTQRTGPSQYDISQGGYDPSQGGYGTPYGGLPPGSPGMPQVPQIPGNPYASPDTGRVRDPASGTQPPQQPGSVNPYPNSQWDALFGPSGRAWDQSKYEDLDDYMDALAKWAPLLASGYQWSNEFGEGNKRYWDASDWGKQTDIYGMGMQGRQQAMAELEANRAYGLGRDYYGLEQELGRSNVDIARQQADTGQYNADTNRMLGEAGIGIQQQQNRIDQMWKSGQLSNEQREIALGELAQSQKYELDKLNYGLSSEIGLGNLGLARQTQAQDEAFRRYQLGEQSKLSREQMANEALQARYAAFGRSQAPAGRIVSGSWY